MKKIKLTIKELFEYQGFDNTQYEKEQIPIADFYIKTPTDETVKINAFIKKRDNTILEVMLDDGTCFKCSDRHIIIDEEEERCIKDANSVLTVNGSRKITSKKVDRIGDVYDISIPAPHLYVTPNGVIHHNTSLARIIVNDILKCDYLYINASDESGIDTIRYKVTNFSQTKSFDGGVKVVILDESDFLSTTAQAALRNTMETYAKYTRFILTANYKHRIIPALQSRCQFLDIKPTLEDSVKRCYYILKQEGIEVEESQKRKFVELVKTNFPDLRKCINELQKNSINGVLAITGVTVDNSLLETIFSAIEQKQVITLRKTLIECEDRFYGDYDNLMKDFLNYLYDKPLDDLKKKEMIAIIADHLWRSAHVLDKEINCFACWIALEGV